MPFDTGNRTVEHFRPKSVSPNLAYEWSNYRLVCGTLNGRRGSDLDVLDPFRVQDGWFILDFPSVLVRPNPTLSARRTARVLHTIEKLGLNDEGTCRKMRLRYVKEFCTHQVTFEYLQTDAPFLAKEIQRLGLEKSLAAMMGY